MSTNELAPTEAPVAVKSMANQRLSREGFLYKENGFLFMFMSGAFTEAELAMSIHTWGCAGFLSSEGSPANAYNANEFYADVGQTPVALVPRKPIPMELKGYVLHGVPSGADITIEGQHYTADGTPIELSFSHSGTFKVQVVAFPYLDGSVEVTYET